MKEVKKIFTFKDIYLERKRNLIAMLVKREMDKNFAAGYPRIIGLSYDMMLSTININGLYEKDFLEILIRWLSINDLIHGSAIDVGANIGNHSVFFSNYFQEVFSFEPNPLVFKVLSLNAEMNSNKIKCFQYGVSDKNRSVRFYTPNKTHVSSSRILEDDNTRADDFITINLVSLDSIEELQNKKIGLVKIDVEGHEFSVLNGTKQLIINNFPVILFEQKKRDFKGGTSPCIKLLKDYGYNFYKLAYNPDRGMHLSTMKRSLNFAKSLLFGSALRIKREEVFLPSNYNFIIAVHGKMLD